MMGAYSRTWNSTSVYSRNWSSRIFAEVALLGWSVGLIIEWSCLSTDTTSRTCIHTGAHRQSWRLELVVKRSCQKKKIIIVSWYSGFPRLVWRLAPVRSYLRFPRNCSPGCRGQALLDCNLLSWYLPKLCSLPKDAFASVAGDCCKSKTRDYESSRWVCRYSEKHKVLIDGDC